MCKCIQLRFSCQHINIITLSPCRGTYSRYSRHDDACFPSCSSRVGPVSIAQSSKCPWCARKQMYATIREPVEYIRTVNYNHRTAATKNAVAEAEAKYDRDVADLNRMNLTQPGRWQKMTRLFAHERVSGGSPLRRELKPRDLVGSAEEDAVDDGHESDEDDAPSPSLMADVVSRTEGEEGVMPMAAAEEENVEERKNNVNKPVLPRDFDGDVQMLDVGSDPLCRCRPGYLCEYC